MCGIVGMLELSGEPVEPPILKGMTDEIAHRGPDGEGYWIEGSVGLGHRRLSVIDLSGAASQPMVSRDGRWVLTYNGEVYNFRDLKSRLQDLGHQFRSRSDTEVVLNALIEWGVSALTMFNGMFALALWDRQNRRLVLARDRYGIKPLYTAMQDRRFFFASEQKSILRYPGFRRHLDTDALVEYLTFQNLFTSRTLVRDVSLLPPGSWVSIEPFQGRMSPVTRYWDFSFEPNDDPWSRQECLEELDRLFVQAVERQLQSDVEIGAYLSGGIDSGAVTAIAASRRHDLKSFTCGFDMTGASASELLFDERHKAEAMSSLFRTEHYEMVLKASDMERALPLVTKHIEEPRVGQSYPNFYAANLAGHFVKVVLSGIGGDELFGGYPWRYFSPLKPPSFEGFVDEYYLRWQRLVSNRELKALLGPISSKTEGIWTRDTFRDVLLQHSGPQETPADFVNLSLYFEAKTFLHGLLVVEDKLSMAHGLETRVPFLDNDLVDFAMKIPVEMKVSLGTGNYRLDENDPVNKPQAYFESTGNGKLILREMLARYVPETISEGVKQGFSAPDASWFRGASSDFIDRRLFRGESPLFDYLDRASVRRLVHEHVSGVRNRRLLVWSLLYLDEWLTASGNQWA